jgi:hypothetical protein
MQHMTPNSVDKARIRKRDQQNIPLIGVCSICGAKDVETSRHHLYYPQKFDPNAVIEVGDECDNSARSAWAKADGFTNFGAADKWFTARYGEDWYLQMWTVIRWNEWLERYFMPDR